MLANALFHRHPGFKPNPYAPVASMGHASLRQGLCFAALQQPYGGSHIFNQVNHVKGVFSGTTKPSWRANGVFFIGGGTAAACYVDFSTDAQTQDIALGAFTMMARTYVKSTDTYIGAIAERNDGNTVGAGWMFAHRGICLERASVNLRAAVGSDPARDKWVICTVVYPGTLSATAVKIYWDAVLQTHATDADGSGAQSSDSANSFFMGRATFASASVISIGDHPGVIDFLYIWKRQLRHEEILALQVDPYALFRQPDQSSLIRAGTTHAASVSFANATTLSAALQRTTSRSGTFAHTLGFTATGQRIIARSVSFSHALGFSALGQRDVPTIVFVDRSLGTPGARQAAITPAGLSGRTLSRGRATNIKVTA